jgi:NTE family protein
MARVGLVLGAGGIVGQAYQAGVLAALEHDLGWDPRTADLIVGSSAGSVTGAALRLGVPAHDLAAFAVEASISPEGEALFGRLDGHPELEPFVARSMLRPWRLPTAALVARAARRPWSFRPSVAAVTMLPAGQVDIHRHARVLDEVTGGAMPEGLWICAVRRSDGARVVFGRPGAPDADLSQAVAASCAIPGYFAPVRIGGRAHVDGGVHSSTNADVLRDADLDLVVIVASMSAAGGRAPTPDAAVRWATHRRLEREVRKLRATGTDVVCIEPRRRSLAAMGLNAMAEDRADRVVRAAFFDAGRRIASPGAGARLAPLADPERRRSTAAA